jgi:hypothetical protein
VVIHAGSHNITDITHPAEIYKDYVITDKGIWQLKIIAFKEFLIISK